MNKELNFQRQFICRLVKLNERGFFTIVGLCLLLITTIFIKGVHEFETNYARGITNFLIEHKLQNLADSYLIETFEKYNGAEDNLNITENLGNIDELKNVAVEIRYAPKQNIKIENGSYTNFENLPVNSKGTVIVIVASCDSPFIAGKMYRRAFAYILDDAPTTIHYLNSL